MVSASAEKKRRALRCSGPCDQDCRHATLIGSNPRRLYKVKGDALPCDGPRGLFVDELSDDDGVLLSQAAAARQPDCHAVRADTAQSAHRSQQLRAVHRAAAARSPTTVQVSFQMRWRTRDKWISSPF